MDQGCVAASSQRKAEEKRAKKAKKVERTEGGA
jgi:hypothetical protein